MKSLSKLHLVPALILLAIFTLSCDSSSNPEPVSGESGGLTIEFDNIVGDKNLVLNGTTYTNSSGEDFVVTKLNYYISNIKLTRQDGSIYTVPQDSSYFLIMESNKESQFVKLKNIPTGDYKAVEFMVGVDSLRNTAPIEKRTGVLDPGGSMTEDGMYWAWNSGYIFLKLEGSSSKATSANNKFYYHIGLFGGYDIPTVNNTRTVKVDFGSLTASVSTSDTPEVHLLVDILKVFDGPSATISIAQYTSVMSQLPLVAQSIANNYATMFSIDHIH